MRGRAWNCKVPFPFLLTFSCLVLCGECVFLHRPGRWPKNDGQTVTPVAPVNLEQVGEPVRFYLFNDPQLILQDEFSDCSLQIGRPGAQATFDNGTLVDITEVRPTEEVFRQQSTEHEMFIKQLHKHPWRILDTEEIHKAEVLVVPFDVDKSRMLGYCNGSDTTHAERVHSVVKYIRNLDTFKERPEDYFWMLHNWRLAAWYDGDGYTGDEALFPYPADREILQQMTVGRYEWWRTNRHQCNELYQKERPSNMTTGPMSLSVNMWTKNLRAAEEPMVGCDNRSQDRVQWEYWRCTVVAPYVHNRAIPIITSSYDDWKARPTRLFFRYEKRAYMWGATELRNKAWYLMGQEFPDQIGDSASGGDYGKQLAQSRFCLVLRGDTPTSHHFFDAIAASCIPVLISDNFAQVGSAFNASIDMMSATLQIKESAWMKNPRESMLGLNYMDPKKIRSVLENIAKLQKHLLWEHPESDTATALLRQKRADCGREVPAEDATFSRFDYWPRYEHGPHLPRDAKSDPDMAQYLEAKEVWDSGAPARALVEAAKVFPEFDHSGDGGLDLEEFNKLAGGAGLARRPHPWDDEKVKKEFDLLDLDGDGTIAREEWKKGPWSPVLEGPNRFCQQRQGDPVLC